MSRPNIIEDFENYFSRFITELNERFDIPFTAMMNIINNKISTPVVPDTRTVSGGNVCEGIVKSRGSPCGAKVSAKSVSGKYCGRHLKLETTSIAKEVPTEYEGSLIWVKNEFGRLTFGKTKLILKSAEEMYVIGTQDDESNISDLTPEDIDLCKKFRFKYIRNYSKA